MIKGYVPFQIASSHVLVDEGDTETARIILDEYEAKRIAHVERALQLVAPYCYFCGDPVDEQQSPCSACGQGLDWSEDPIRRSALPAVNAVAGTAVGLLLLAFFMQVSSAAFWSLKV